MSLVVVRVDGVPAVTALKFRDGLQLGVGTSTGQVRVDGGHELGKDYTLGSVINP